MVITPTCTALLRHRPSAGADLPWKYPFMKASQAQGWSRPVPFCPTRAQDEFPFYFIFSVAAKRAALCSSDCGAVTAGGEEGWDKAGSAAAAGAELCHCALALKSGSCRADRFAFAPAKLLHALLAAAEPGHAGTAGSKLSSAMALMQQLLGFLGVLSRACSPSCPHCRGGHRAAIRVKRGA